MVWSVVSFSSCPSLHSMLDISSASSSSSSQEYLATTHATSASSTWEISPIWTLPSYDTSTATKGWRYSMISAYGRIWCSSICSTSNWSWCSGKDWSFMKSIPSSIQLAMLWHCSRWCLCSSTSSLGLVLWPMELLVLLHISCSWFGLSLLLIKAIKL